MAILVTGGAGYIGAHTVRALRRRGHDVVVLDDLSRGHPAAVPDAVLVHGSIQDRALVAELIGRHGVAALVHFAARKAVGESVTDPGRYFDDNVGGTAALLRTAAASGVGHVVFSSSAAVYGTPEYVPIREDHPLRPESPYGESKVLVERMLPWFERSHGMTAVSLRYFNAAGAAADGRIGEDFAQTTNLVPLVKKAALGRSGPLSVFGTDYPTRDGTCVRDYVHVEDLADAHVLALEHLQRSGASAVLNLGTGVGATVREVLDAAQRASGLDIPAVEVARRAGDPAELVADTTRARAILGWHPTRGLDEIVASAWAWHSAHPDGYGKEAVRNPSHS
jgi:UDP-glucose 4-epimerase